MKKRVFGRYLSRERDTRRALFKSLVRSMVVSGKIKTTRAKAKAIQGEIEGLVTLGKKGDITAVRKIQALLGHDRNLTGFVINKIVPVFSSKNGGYTRIINLPRRVGDNSRMVRIEWSLEVEKYILPEEIKKKAKDKSDKEKKEEKKGKVSKIVKAIKKK